MEKTGEKFCSFLMERLRNCFDEIPEDLRLEFCTGKQKIFAKIQGKRKSWPDSRLEASSGTLLGAWIFCGHIEDVSLQIFLKMILEELEKRITNLLYVETVEEHMLKYVSHGEINWDSLLKDNIISFFIGNLLSREWLITQYIRIIIERKKLPPLDFLIQISAQKYERRTVQTSLYFVDKIPDIDVDQNMIMLEDMKSAEMEILPENLRTIRKMMEMSGKDCGLLVCRDERERFFIVGAVYKEISAMQATEVRFTEHLSWKVIEKGQILFECREGKYRIPILEGEEANDEWRTELRELKDKCSEFTREKIGTIEDIISHFKVQIHGTSIVFMEENLLDEEVKRLSSFKKAYLVKPFPVLGNEKRIWGISAIDGAIVADIHGKCHLTGAIFDGVSVVKGDPGRGARFNSLKNYVNWVCQYYNDGGEKFKKSWCLAAVLSEDKSVNLIFQTV